MSSNLTVGNKAKSQINETSKRISHTKQQRDTETNANAADEMYRNVTSGKHIQSTKRP